MAVKALSEFTNDEYMRVAIVYDDKGTYGALLYSHGRVVHDRKCPGHSLQYVEDLAENWINRWGDFKDD